jgi:Leucine-rich repeat (LRR) protein
MTSIALYCKNLQSLVCTQHLTAPFDSIGDILHGCSFLRILFLDNIWFPALNSTAFEVVNNQSLESVTLSHFTSENETALAVLGSVTNLQNLKLFRFQGIIGKRFISLFEPHNNLRRLSLEQCRSTDAELVRIVRVLPHLEHLDLTGCERITDTSVVALAENLTALRTLNLNETQITDKSIHALAMHRFSTLTALFLNLCWSVADPDSISFLLRRCTKLRKLELDTNDEAVRLNFVDASLLSSLTTLILSCECAMPNSVFSFVSQHCTNLQHLYIDSDNILTNPGLVHIALHCSKLCTLVLVNTDKNEESGATLLPLAEAMWNALRPSLRISYDPVELGYNIFTVS